MEYDFDKVISGIYSKIIDKYGFKVKTLTDQTISLINNKFAIDFTMSRDGVDLSYVQFCKNNDALNYDIREYIVDKITDKDREGIDLQYSTFYEKIIIILKIDANTLNNHFTNILNGDDDWMDDYKKSKFFNSPRMTKKNIYE